MTHAHTKAGAPAVVAKRVLAESSPSFDPNRVDIWGKRMNTLRRFISLVSRFIFRDRMVQRMDRIHKRWHENGAYSREEVKEFIEVENAEAKMAGPQSTSAKDKDKKEETSEGEAPAEFKSVAEMVCSATNDIADNREKNEAVLGAVTNRYEFTTDMVRRVLFPKFTAEEAGTREKMQGVPMEDVPSFDDRTFFLLKVRPEFVSMGYELEKVPAVAVSFPPARDKSLRDGAAEECIRRPAADAGLKYAEMMEIVPEELLLPLPPHLKEQVTLVDTEAEPEFDELSMAAPAWMGADPSWKTPEVDYFRLKQSASQVYRPLPRRCEMDDDWVLRPLGEQLEYDEDLSLRSQWIREGAFMTANTYLLAGQETRNIDGPAPPGPTLCDTYNLNADRHFSGLTSFANEHTRALDQEDVDIAPMQEKQAEVDELSDSESDDEDAYRVQVPSLAKAKAIVRSPEDIAAAEEEARKQMEASIDSMEGLSADPERTNEQVELMRDRKILELEEILRKQRQTSMSTIAATLQECAAATVNRATALSFQLPFHLYEEELLQGGVFDGPKGHADIPLQQLSFHEEHQFRGTLNTMGSPAMSPMKTPHP